METTHTLAPQTWGYDTTTGRQLVPPTPDELVQLQDENGLVFNDQNEPVLVPGPDYHRQVEEVELDTVVILDEQAQTAFKFVFSKDALAHFLAAYVEHLDVEGRKVLRDALTQATGIIVPELDTSGLKLLPGGKE